MIILFIILFLLLLLLIWVPIDLFFGRRFYHKKVQQHIFPIRYSSFTFFTYGSNLYKEMFKDIEQAEHHVHILFYIIRDDEISKEFCSLLCKKAKEGCDVRVLIDRIGGHTFPKSSIKLFKDSNVSFSFTNKVKLPFLLFSLNHRNHRKIAIIDGKIGYLGGFNIGAEYLGLSAELGSWHDYHMRITDEGVADLQKQFLEDWKRATVSPLPSNSHFYPELKKGTSKHQFVTTNGLHLHDTFEWVLSQAREEIIIATPYFIPNKKLFHQLKTLVKNNITLHILIPQKEDHPLIQEASLPFLEELRQNGAYVHMYQEGFFHGKAILIDDTLADIGTANFDLRSLYLNDEMNCLIYDKQAVASLKKHLLHDIAHSNLLTDHFYLHVTSWSRFKRVIAKLFLQFF